MPEVVPETPQLLGTGHVFRSGSKSRPGVVHITVIPIEAGKLPDCTCEGWRYHKKCKHVTYCLAQVGEPEEEVQVSL